MRRLLLVSVLCAWPLLDCSNSGTVVPPPPLNLSAGGATLKIADGGASVTFARGDVELLSFPADAFQLGVVDTLDDTQSYDPYWLEFSADGTPPEPPSDLTWLSPESATATAVDGSHATIALGYKGLDARVAIEARDAGHFVIDVQPAANEKGPKVAYVRVRPRTRGGDKEGFYGLGEWADSVDHRGKLRSMQMEPDPNLESSDNEAHVPIPWLVGSRGWAVFAESKRVGAFDVARKDPALVEITYGAPSLTLHLFSESEPIDLTKRYYELTGYPRVPAIWALGPWIWRDENKDQAQVLDDIAKIRSLDLATSAVWIDRPYATAVNTFDFAASQFPDPPAMIQAIHDAGLRLALWSTPYLEKSAEPLRSIAVGSNYFPPQTSVPLNGWSAPIDFTNRAAFDFWQSNVRKYTSLGVEGFKLDYAEDLVPSLRNGRNVWRFADGSDERTMHHGYTVLYHRAYAETLPKGGSYVLARAARWGDQANVDVIWPGDMDATFTKHRERFKDRSGAEHVGVGGLPATVVMGLGLGASGFPFFGADTGGYRHSPPDKELFVRWFEQTALSTVMNVGDSSSETPWEFSTDNGRDQEALDLYRVYARLHMRLHAYEWTYAQRIAKDGRPIQRPVGLAFPRLGVHPSDEYLFGEELLVAPVLERGATTRAVLLPPGDWIDWTDGALYSGGEAGGVTVTVAAPLGKLPLFIRAGSCVPLLRPTIDAIAPTTLPPAQVDSFATRAGVLWTRVAVAPSKTAAFDLWDGAHVEATSTAGGVDLSTHDGAAFVEGQIIELVRTAAPQSVTIGGASITKLDTVAALEAADKGWFWESAAGGTLWIRVPPGGQHVAVR